MSTVTMANWLQISLMLLLKEQPNVCRKVTYMLHAVCFAKEIGLVLERKLHSSWSSLLHSASVLNLLDVRKKQESFAVRAG